GPDIPVPPVSLARSGPLREGVDRERATGSGPRLVDGLPVGDRDQPGLHVATRSKGRIRPQRRQKRLRPCVIGVHRPEDGPAHPEHGRPMRGYDLFERWQGRAHLSLVNVPAAPNVSSPLRNHPPADANRGGSGRPPEAARYRASDAMSILLCSRAAVRPRPMSRRGPPPTSLRADQGGRTSGNAAPIPRHPRRPAPDPRPPLPSPTSRFRLPWSSPCGSFAD